MRKILLGTALTLCFSAPAFAQVATMDVKDAANATRTINTNPGRGSGLAGNSMMVVLPTDQTPIPVTKSGTWSIDSIVSLPPLATGSNLIGSVSQSGAWNVTNITGTVTLPTGAATSAKQPALGVAGTPSTDVLTVQGAASGTALKVDNSAVTQPVSASSLPLPTGAATSAAQTTANTSLASIVTNTAAVPSGAATSVNQTTANSSLASIATNTAQPSSLTTGQVTCATTATQIAAARSGRKAITIIQEGTTLVRLGGSAVTTGTGVPVPGTQYASFTIDGGAAVYCIVGTGTQLVSYVEAY